MKLLSGNIIMILSGDYVRILKGYYKGEIGIVKSFDGFAYRIKLLKKSLEVKIPESELKIITKEELEEDLIKIRFDDGTQINLKDTDLQYTCNCLKSNFYFKGLFALGKYYSKEEYPDKYNKDYFTQQILRIKNFDKNAVEDIAKIYIYFINCSKILKDIVDKVDFVCLMPNINYKNHVEQWGRILCEKFDIPDISYNIYIKEDKIDELRYYKYKKARERYKIINGAFQIKKDNLNLEEKICLILDDICTTGLQINELTDTLVEVGTKETYAFVIGRTKY